MNKDRVTALESRVAALERALAATPKRTGLNQVIDVPCPSDLGGLMRCQTSIEVYR